MSIVSSTTITGDHLSELGRFIVRTEEKVEDYESDELPIVKLSSKGLEVVGPEAISREDLKDYLLIKSGETFVCNFFESKRFSHKRALIHLYKGQGSALTSGKNYYTFKVDQHLVDEYFLEVVFTSSAFKKRLRELEIENQSFDFLPEEEFKRIKVDFPCLSLQKEKVEKLQIMKQLLMEKKKQDVLHYLGKIKKCNCKLLERVEKDTRPAIFKEFFIEYQQLKREMVKALTD